MSYIKESESGFLDAESESYIKRKKIKDTGEGSRLFPVFFFLCGRKNSVMIY